MYAEVRNTAVKPMTQMSAVGPFAAIEAMNNAIASSGPNSNTALTMTPIGAIKQKSILMY
jgi:hypothetical protein